MRFIGNVEEDTQIRAVASGTLSNGDTVVVNSDGTVSAVSETAVSEAVGSADTFSSGNTRYTSVVYDAGNDKVVVAYFDVSEAEGNAVVGTVDPDTNSITYGAEVTFETGDPLFIVGTYDANAGKVVFAYADDNNAKSGTAVVGTVSGSSISFGTPVVFSGECEDLGITYDANAQKIVVVYRDVGNSNYGTARVGTVSGSSISFGTAVVFESSLSLSNTICYDEAAQKNLVVFQDGAVGDARVGTVSGTSISFGSNVNFNAGSIGYPSIAYDAGIQKCIVAYQDGAPSGTADDHGTAQIATITGTSVSFGTKYVYKAVATAYNQIVYNAAAGKIVISFRDDDNVSDVGEIVTGTASGSTITYDTPIEFEAGKTSFISSAYDSNNGKVITTYEDEGTNVGHYVVYQAAYNATNITAENFIGFADSGYLSGQNVGIDSTGSVNRSQSGLTAGQKYYVQNDGSLGTTADDPSVEAGVAISATEILVKG